MFLYHSVIELLLTFINSYPFYNYSIATHLAFCRDFLNFTFTKSLDTYE